MKKRFLIIILTVFIFEIAHSQSKTIQIRGIAYRIFDTIYPVNVRVDPPSILGDGHWIASYDDSTIAFKGFYSGGNPQDTFCFYDEDRVEEMFFFKNRQPIWCKEYWWLTVSYRTNKHKWRLSSVLVVDSEQNTITEKFYNAHGILVEKNIYEYSDEFGPPFIRAYEGTAWYLNFFLNTLI